MGKSTPQAPAAPDPVATANAQAAANTKAAETQANLNRIDQITPQGSIKYTQNGTNSDGTPKYTQTQTYSPEQQALYSQQNQVAQALGGLATNNISKVAATQGQDFNFNGMTPLQTGVANAGAITSGQTSANPVQTAINGAGNIQKGLDFSGASKLPGIDDFSADATKAQNASYAQATSRLDPQYNQQESDYKAQLANSGISENSDAYRRQMDNFARNKTDAYNQANYSAQAAGSAEQSRLFGLALQGRQQGVGEATAQGQFANSAQDQQFQQNQAGAQFFNDANNQQFQQNQQAVATNNTAQNQQFNQNLTNTNLNNTARQQQIEESTYLRNLPLQDIAALLGTGGGVQQPNFSGVSQVGVAAPDYQGAVYANYNAANQQYQAAQTSKGAGLGSIFGLAGSLGAAAISDNRLKHTIREIGKLANGLRTFVFSYVGCSSRHFGVMAQDVFEKKPEAIIFMGGGYMAVDYGKVW